MKHCSEDSDIGDKLPNGVGTTTSAGSKQPSGLLKQSITPSHNHHPITTAVISQVDSKKLAKAEKKIQAIITKGYSEINLENPQH